MNSDVVENESSFRNYVARTYGPSTIIKPRVRDWLAFVRKMNSEHRAGN